MSSVECFYRIGNDELMLTSRFVCPFDEVTASKAPHIVIDHPPRNHDDWSSTKHILVPQETIDAINLWFSAQNYAGMSLHEFLDSMFEEYNYA